MLIIHNRILASFGFLADFKLSPSHNAFIHLESMPAWYYFDRPHNMAFHDLTTTAQPPRNLRSLLGLGLKFCPTPRFSTNCVADTFLRFHHDLFCKIFYTGKPFDEDNDYDPKMYINPNWTPEDW